MASPKTKDAPRILTANALLSGRTVYWNGTAWCRSADEALRATTSQEIAELEARGAAEEMVNMVVGAYLVPVSEGGTIEPLELRERRRISGPSIGLPGAATA
ncbi:MAG: DUF2849 domain-containing protein [Rhizobiales bacterium]|nr:DUF2849 domain-containing protein [Hyphomicrobiales bacterium]MBO6698624.1 DUF2849 domain-containing protein [Hyphomicrobiales bacterium]MBO6735123.1 DUF2849 domain-containing protein [Hyphomicrobiales bacterium]MBO6911070.1 DUF2849 domain-containing protein [Hyphomicrobiales bacterium]MBO6957362.1 DUF2849 domain-containing protein [Hyphomicrobiales bacterium]